MSTAEGIRALVFGSDDISKEVVTVPEWGGVTFELRSPSLRQRARLQELGDGEGKVNTTTLYPILIVACAYAPDSSEPIFTTDDIEALQDKSTVVMERVGEIAMRVAGLAAKSVVMGKDDSSPTVSGDTPSA